MKKIPQIKPFVGKREVLEIADSISKGWLSGGPKLKEFESRVANFHKVKYGIGVCNGTQALYLGLKVLGIKKGDEVIVPDFTFIASANAVTWTGARPVFVDIDKTLTIDSSKIEEAITERTKAIMPVHLYGKSANMDNIRKIADKYNLYIIEDAAQAFGIKYRGKSVGGIGDIGCLSFYADKVITTGEGGMVLTNDDGLARSVRILINQGRNGRGWYIHDYIGYNFRMTDIQAGIGLAQLSKFEFIKKKKMEIYNLYRKYLSNVKLRKHSFYRVVVEVDCAKKLLDFLVKNGIEVKRSFYPLHLQPCYTEKYIVMIPDDERFPNSFNAYKKILTLPSSIDLEEKDIKYISSKIKEFYAKN